MLRYSITSLHTLLFLSVLHCSFQQKVPLKRTVVEANGFKLTVQSFGDMLASELKSYDALTIKSDKTLVLTKSRIINNFVTNSILKSWAKRNSIIVKQEDIDERIAQLKSGYPNELAFRQALSSESVVYKDWIQKIKNLVLHDKVHEALKSMVVPPTEAELKTYYKHNKPDFQRPAQIHLRQIVLKSQHNAKNMLRELKKGAEMKDLAPKFSITPEGANQGDLGWIDKGSSDLFEKAFKLRKGQKSSVVKSPYGFHIFQVIDKRRSKTLSFDKVKKDILGLLLEKKFEGFYFSWLEKEFVSSKVFKDESLINAVTIKIQD